jgi:hypothetical protein
MCKVIHALRLQLLVCGWALAARHYVFRPTRTRTRTSLSQEKKDFCTVTTIDIDERASEDAPLENAVPQRLVRPRLVDSRHLLLGQVLVLDHGSAPQVAQVRGPVHIHARAEPCHARGARVHLRQLRVGAQRLRAVDHLHTHTHAR